MKDTLINFETAKLAKEKGFKKVKCDYYFDKSCKIQKEVGIDNLHRDGHFNKIAAPTQSLLAKWLREKYNLYTESQMYIEEGLYKFKYVIKSDFEYDLIVLKEKYNFSTYEEAYEIGLQEALKLI